MPVSQRGEAFNFIEESGLLYTLRLMILALLASALVISALTFLLGWRVIPEICLLAAGSLTVAFLLFRAARFRWAVWLAFATVIYAVMHAAAGHDGMQTVGLAFVPVLIVIVSLLLEPLILTIFTGVAILAACCMLAIRCFLLQREQFSANDAGDLCIFAVICVVAAFLGRLVASQINNGFVRVWESEGRYRDISEQLRRRAEELQQIMDVAPVALFVANDPECREVTINRMGNAMFEFPPTANSASSPAGPTPPGSFFRDGVEISARELPLQTAARGIEVQDAEFEVALPSGARRILRGHARPLRDVSGAVRGAIAVGEDVTEERRRTAALLLESEERFRQAADATPVMIWFSDAQNRLVFVNQEMTRFTGIPAEQLLGDHWIDPIHPDDLEHIRAMYYAHSQHPAAYQVEFRMRSADLEYRHMLCSMGPRYAGETYLGWAGSNVDITGLKRRQHEDLARQKLESLGTLASGIAHDFNNLLASVLAQADLAVEDYASGESPERGLEQIRKVALRGSEIVRQLMVYSGKESAEVGLVDVSQIIAEMIELLDLSLSKRATIETELGANLPQVKASAGQIRQIVMNLVMNASEAIGAESGTIHVKTRCIKEPVDGIAPVILESHRDRLEFEVRDTGVGMSPEIQAKIFDPFFTTKSAGHGLGLAVVDGIVRNLNGKISVAGAPGVGTVIKVSLPCAATPAGVPEEPVPDAAVPAVVSENTPVLVVEDEQALRHAVVKLLRRQRFEVVEAANGSEALIVLGERGGELKAMLLDMTLPGASSDEIISEAGRTWPHIKIILTSAYSPEMLADRMTAPQVAGFLRKPYQIGDVIKTIRDNCNCS